MKPLYASLLLPIVFLFSYNSTCNATHIVGGNISYECLGPNPSTGDMRYKIVMYAYRDFINGVPPFDNPAMLGIYTGNNSNSVFMTLALSNPVITTIPIDLGNPCLIVPQDLGVEEAVYEGTVELPFDPSGYWISYQRCCRNGSINNLSNPSAEGATYTIFLNEISQQQCNSSPSFNSFPPVLICLNKPLTFDHSATDIDGNTLEYEFCTPFHGGGQQGSGFNSPAPNPPAPPPYTNIQFATNFSAQNPMPATPSIVIDANTGLLTGMPTAQGQYVVGVCVKEYDALGNLLSVTLRDFQFNVAVCDDQVDAQIMADSVDFTTDNFYVESCGDSIITFDNTSTIQSFISSYEWRIDLGNGNFFTSSDYEPTLSFPSNGVYNGWLIANPGATGCTDTALLTISISMNLSADFTMDYDPCEIGSVTFNNLTSLSSNLPILSYEWEFGDGNVSDVTHPVHTYNYPDTGLRSISLRAEDITGCIATISKALNWVPLPVFPLVLENSTSCVPVDANSFESIHYPISGYTFSWDFGDGNISNQPLGSHSYTLPGSYDRSLTVVSPAGCSQNFSSKHIALESPMAAFSYSPTQLTSFNSFVQFTDLSELAILWEWQFGTADSKISSSSGNTEYQFQDTGKHEVSLIVHHANSCTDTAMQIVDIVPQVTFFMPNAFSPNSDGSNDIYKGKGHTEFIKKFNMSIYNRWGEHVFQTNNSNEAWNGRKNNTGKKCQTGVYVVLVLIEGPRGKQIEIKGFATIIY